MFSKQSFIFFLYICDLEADVYVNVSHEVHFQEDLKLQ